MNRTCVLVLLAACSSGGHHTTEPTGGTTSGTVDAAAGGDASAAVTVPEGGATTAGTAGPAATPPQSTAPNAATLAKLGWDATTASYVLRSPTESYAQPNFNAEPLGRITAGTRLPIGESADGDKHCAVWLAAVPRGWVCARYARASTKPPEAIPLPVIADGALLPNEYFGVKEGAKRYATAEDVENDHPKPEPKTKSTYMVTKDKPVKIDGVTYFETPVGLVGAKDLYKLHPSTFAGVDLIATPPPAWPFAWVIAKDKESVTARATPDKKGEAAGTYAHRAIVPVLEELNGFVRVADGQWIDRKSLRVARTRPKPDAADAAAKWIDLDRDEQVLVAYDGDKPVFATLFSSGRHKTDTPPALYRIRSKSAVTKMAAEEREASYYAVSEVPWATRFRSGLYFHAAYWHDGFGNARSHGCVNLSPTDARWIYQWTEPTMPPGWDELEIAIPGSMIVYIHDAKHPDPPVFDYELEAKQRVKIRKQEKKLREAREAAEAAAEADAAAGTGDGATDATGTVVTPDVAPAPAPAPTPAPAPPPPP